jgi:hypothetical protein
MRLLRWAGANNGSTDRTWRYYTNSSFCCNMVLMFLVLQVLCCYSPWALSLWTHNTWIQVGAACAHNHPSESHHSCQSVAVRSALCLEGCAIRLCRPYQTWTVCFTYTGITAVNPETNLSVTRGYVLLAWCSLCLLVPYFSTDNAHLIYNAHPNIFITPFDV